MQFTNCVKFHFGKCYLQSDSHTNTVVSDSFAYPSRWRRKPWLEKSFSGLPDKVLAGKEFFDGNSLHVSRWQKMFCLDLLLGLSMVWWCSSNRSWERRNDVRLKAWLNQHRRKETVLSLYLGGLVWPAELVRLQNNHPTLCRFLLLNLFRIYCVCMGIRWQTTFPIMPIRTRLLEVSCLLYTLS